VLAHHANSRMARLDRKGEHYSAVDNPTFSASGAVTE
jgi:hypothetical protein